MLALLNCSKCQALTTPVICCPKDFQRSKRSLTHRTINERPNQRARKEETTSLSLLNDAWDMTRICSFELWAVVVCACAHGLTALPHCVRPAYCKQSFALRGAFLARFLVQGHCSTVVWHGQPVILVGVGVQGGPTGQRIKALLSTRSLRRGLLGLPGQQD